MNIFKQKNSLSRATAIIFSGLSLWISPLAMSQSPSEKIGVSEMSASSNIPYGIGEWKLAYGNHRALVSVGTSSDAVKVSIPWRRRDTDVANKNVMVVDSQSGEVVNNRVAFDMSREAVDLVFQPTSGAGIYEVYYLIRQRKPNPIKGANQGHFPATVYVTPQDTADPEWVSKHQLKTPEGMKSLTPAKVKAFEALKVTGPKEFEGFNSFYPMEVIATQQETQALVKRYASEPMLIFPEGREMPIRMTEDLPMRWIENGPSREVVHRVDKNEFFTFQLGVYALDDLKNFKINFHDLEGEGGEQIKASTLRCFNLGGVNYDGKTFKKDLHISKGTVQALWMGLDVPAKAKSGSYKGMVTLSAEGSKDVLVEITVQVTDQYLADKGDSDVWRLTRLRWLDSDIGIDNDVLAPFTPIEVVGDTMNILGRKICLGKDGLPTSVVSHIALSEITEQGREVLNRPVRFVVETQSGEIPFESDGLKVTKQTPGKISFESHWRSKGFTAHVTGTLECDGYMRYRIALKALHDVNVDDICVELPFRKELARYLMGRLGVEGKIWKDTYSGYRPASAEAPIEKGMMYNTVWSGDYNAGLGMLLKNDEDEWNGDNKSKYDVPSLPGWENNGQGRYVLKEDGGTALISVHNGKRHMKVGEVVSFNFALLVTPFKPITKDHWDYRIYHAPYETEVKLEAAANARVVNVHHANTHNPYINYPFLKDDYLKGFIDKAHAEDRKVKLYYTIRELSTRTAEFWALRSLGEEIFIKDEGYLSLTKHPLSHQQTRFHRAGYPWLAEHLVDDYRMRWHSTIKKSEDPEKAKLIGREIDASIATQGLCRWHNYYLEGLKYLMKDIGADGLYLDGIGYDREIMKRVRKTMLESGKSPMIDFHGAVHQNWMTLAPYLDSIWYGEGTRYDFGEDYWLVAVSGIPFGLTGEILKSDRHANIHRGMLYGMSKRLGWRGNRQSQYVWKIWDDFGIKDSKHIGYFAENCPIKSDNDQVKISVYQKKGKTLLAIASWLKEPANVNLTIDWKALGLNSSQVKMFAPEIKTMQKAEEYQVGKPLLVPAFNGKLIILQEIQTK